MNTTLYEMTWEYAEASEVLEDPDLPEEAVRDTLEALKTGIAIKAQNIAAMIQNLEAEATKIEVAEERLSDRRQSLQNRAEWLRGYLLTNMRAVNLNKLRSPNGLFTIAVRQNPPSVSIEDQSLIPKRFMKTVTTVSVDKAGLRNELKKDQAIPGACLTTSYRLEIR